MYYTELNPITGEKVYVPKSLDEKAMQRALLQFKDPKNYDLVYKALKMAGREDLIGYDRKCLIPPVKPKRYTKVKRWLDGKIYIRTY